MHAGLPRATATSARLAARRGSRDEGKQLPFPSLGIASSSRPARGSQPRSRSPFLCAVLSSERSPLAAPVAARASRSIGRSAANAGTSRTRPPSASFSASSERRHPLAGLVASPVRLQARRPEPMPKTGDGRPRGRRHQPPAPPGGARPVAMSVSTSVWTKAPTALTPERATKSTSTKPGGGSPQSPKVRTGTDRRTDLAPSRWPFVVLCGSHGLTGGAFSGWMAREEVWWRCSRFPAVE